MPRWPLLLLPLVLAACSSDYPFDRPGTWSLDRMGSSNDANLRAMVANPADLIAGRGETTALGAEAARPVGALRAGKRAALPAVNTLNINTIPTEQAPAGGTGAGP